MDVRFVCHNITLPTNVASATLLCDIVWCYMVLSLMILPHTAHCGNVGNATIGNDTLPQYNITTL
jgi:hypothetical protein